MSRLKCAIDTSAAVSLGSTGKFHSAANLFSFISPSRVREELIEISEKTDEIGEVAHDVLTSNLIEFFTLEIGLESDKGEVEAVNLANKLGADLVLMDDAQARKKLQKGCKAPIRFSPFAIFMLYEKKILTRKEALFALEDMKKKRDWKENVITEYAKLLFEKSEG